MLALPGAISLKVLLYCPGTSEIPYVLCMYYLNKGIRAVFKYHLHGSVVPKEITFSLSDITGILVSCLNGTQILCKSGFRMAVSYPVYDNMGGLLILL